MADEIKKITDTEYMGLIEELDVMSGGKAEPLGLFYLTDKNNKGKTVYIGVDNSSGDVWVEEFRTLGACKRWLLKG